MPLVRLFLFNHWCILCINLLQLGLHITESKSCLETALDLSRDMYKNMSYINMSIESINKELDTQKNMPDLPVNAIYVRVSNRSNA